MSACCDSGCTYCRTCAPLFVTAMVTLDAATLENGCLEIVPGRH